MAYGNYLASVPHGQVVLLRGDPTRRLQPTLIVSVSHLVAYSIKLQPLGQLLGQAVDGGEPLGALLWHPLRPPTYHPPANVEILFHQISNAWESALEREALPDRDWYLLEIEKLLGVFQHGAKHDEGIVSVIEPPHDDQRSRRVNIPFDVAERKA